MHSTINISKIFSTLNKINSKSNNQTLIERFSKWQKTTTTTTIGVTINLWTKLISLRTVPAVQCRPKWCLLMSLIHCWKRMRQSARSSVSGDELQQPKRDGDSLIQLSQLWKCQALKRAPVLKVISHYWHHRQVRRNHRSPKITQQTPQVCKIDLPTFGMTNIKFFGLVSQMQLDCSLNILLTSPYFLYIDHGLFDCTSAHSCRAELIMLVTIHCNGSCRYCCLT